MADLQNFSVTANGNVNISNFPRFTITATVTDSQTSAVLFDFTGANAITFPGDMPTLFPTAAARRAFVERLAMHLVRVKAGLASPLET